MHIGGLTFPMCGSRGCYQRAAPAKQGKGSQVCNRRIRNVLRIIIEQDDRAGASPQVQAFTAPAHTQAMDGGAAPPPRSALRPHAMKVPAPAQIPTSIPGLGNVSVRDAGSAPRVFQAHVMRNATAPIVPGSSGMIKPSDGGAAPRGKA